MTQKNILIAFAIGLVLTGLGAFMKIYRYDFANAVLVAGMVVEAFALVTLIVKSIRQNSKPKE